MVRHGKAMDTFEVLQQLGGEHEKGEYQRKDGIYGT